MTPAEYGRELARQEPPLTREEAKAWARVYVAMEAEAERSAA